MHKFTLMTAILLAVAVDAHADGIPVEPGLWEMTSIISMPMLPQPQTNTMTECFEKSEISVDDVGGQDMDPGCTFETSQLDGATMAWSFDCPLEGGGTSHGEWQATSHGDRVEGNGKITMAMQGQNMEMTMSWQGKRVGDCP
jgi:hypothetical protein